MTQKEKYNCVINFYKKKIKEFGTTNKGLGWESKYKNNIRYTMIKNIIKKNYKGKLRLLDFGCGISGLHIFLKRSRVAHNYTGIDTSKSIINFCKKKFKKNNYYNFNILKSKKKFGEYDVVVLNGLFTIKDRLRDVEMYKYIIQILKILKKNINGLMIINFLIDNPDWKNEKNFYPNTKVLKSKLKKSISNKIYVIKLPKVFENIFILKI